MPEFITNFLWNFSTWAVLGVFGGFVTGQILNPEYLGLLSSAWTTMSSNPYS
ncbi:hypothetical protein [Corynebacterium pacaense]|uniref:hypothetical protein n=1 Tax=Corynebacterium pacaense TaxID=1816684 RepID=UPI0015C4A8AB|nr:hypothetical protein [Corynebacterium pacaense]